MFIINMWDNVCYSFSHTLWVILVCANGKTEETAYVVNALLVKVTVCIFEFVEVTFDTLFPMINIAQFFDWILNCSTDFGDSTCIIVCNKCLFRDEE